VGGAGAGGGGDRPEGLAGRLEDAAAEGAPAGLAGFSGAVLALPRGAGARALAPIIRRSTFVRQVLDLAGF
jgi:hypothetical protein